MTRLRLLGAVGVVCVMAGSAFAQSHPTVATMCNSSGNWIPCTNSGGGGGSGGTTQDDDDASIASGQNTDLVQSLTMAFDGSVWRRLTFGTAGTASAQVLTVQGITNMTPLLVSGTNIDVQIGGSDTVAVSNAGLTELAAAINSNLVDVNIVSGAGSGGTAVADDADFTAGTTSFTPVGGFYQSTVTACTDGDACAARVTAGRAVTVALVNPDGSAASYATDATQDSAASTTGPQTMAIARSSLPSAVTNADAVRMMADLYGRLQVNVANVCADHARVQTAAISNSTSGNVEVVALNGSDLIYVCGYSLVAGAATGVRFVYGTGTACATGETGLTGAWAFATNGGISQANGGAPQFVVPAGNAFCTENTGANAIAGHVTYVRTAAP